MSEANLEDRACVGGLLNLLEMLLHARPIIGMYQLKGVASHEFLRGIPVDAGRRRTGVQKAAIRPQQSDRLRQILNQRTKPPLVGPDRFVDPLVLRRGVNRTAQEIHHRRTFENVVLRAHPHGPMDGLLVARCAEHHDWEHREARVDGLNGRRAAAVRQIEVEHCGAEDRFGEQPYPFRQGPR